MFERTFSFWHRLVGKPAPAPAGDPVERRLWVRYPADLRANVQVTEGAAPVHRVSAQVRDISLGGANLLVNRSFEAGQLLSLELPRAGTEDKHIVLACIVRAAPVGKGQWALGCVFSRELTDDDLEGFGAKRVRHAPSDQRVWMRFATNVKATYQKVGDPDNQTYVAHVINLSASGVGLKVNHDVDSGALLSLDLASTDGKTKRTILACVVHVTDEGSGGRALGCNFIRELSEDDLKSLVKS